MTLHRTTRDATVTEDGEPCIVTSSRPCRGGVTPNPGGSRTGSSQRSRGRRAVVTLTSAGGGQGVAMR